MDTATNIDFSLISPKDQVRFVVARSVNELRDNIKAEHDRLLRLNVGGTTFRNSFLGLGMLLAALVDRLMDAHEFELSTRALKVQEAWNKVDPSSVSYLQLQEALLALGYEIAYSSHERTRKA